MIKCSKCSSENRDDKKYCSNCGAELSVVKHCPNCGYEYDPGDHFCGKCGNNLAQEPSKSPQPVQPQTETQQVEKESEAGTFRKHVTVLVTDMKSSTELIGNLDPEEAKEIIFPAIQKLISIVYEYGGLVISTAGDGLVAVFGASQALENHSLRACLASLAMQNQIKSVNEALSIRIGLNTGEVLIASDGSKYDIVGGVVNLAARMEQTARPGTVRITENTLKLVADNVIVESLGLLEMKGFTEKVDVYELKGIKISKTLNELANQFRERTRYVNREQELAKAMALLADVKTGHGNAISIYADTGFGKSRFIYEIVSSDSAKDCNILYTAGFIHTKDVSLLPIMNLFRGLFGILSNEMDISRIKKQIAPFLTSIDSPQALNAALCLINLSPDDTKWIALEPGLKRRYMFECGTKLLMNYALEKPLILIIEDLHWVDSETEVFLDALLSQNDKYKIFVIISYRPEYHDHFISKSNYTRLELGPLNNEAGSKMLENLLGNDPSLAEIKTKLLTTVEGNPYFLEELVHSLIAEKMFVGEPKKYHLRDGTSVIKIQPSETIISIVQNKIDKLRPIEKKILQIASVIGTKFLYSQVMQLMDPIDEAEMRGAMDRLTSEQYIYESQLFPEPGFAFTHAITSEVAYNSMLKKNRKNLHLKFFQVLESTLKFEQIDQIQIIAEHAFLGENWERAFYYCAIAAQKVYDINAFSSCVRLYERALSAAGHLPQDEATTLKTMRIHYELYCALVPLGRFDEQYTHLEKALELALAKKDRFFESIVNSAFSIHFLGYKDANIALKHVEKAYLIAVEVRSLDAIMISQAVLAHCYFFLGQMTKFFDIIEELEGTIGGNLDYRTEWLRAPIPHVIRYYEAAGRALVGDFATVEKKKDKWFAGSQNLNEPSISNLCRYAGMGVCYYIKGDFEKSIQNLTTALQYSVGTEVIVYIPIFASMLGEMYARLNKKKEGKEYVEQAITVVEKVHANFTTIFSFASIPNALLVLGEPARAKEFNDKAIKIIQERNVNILYPMLLRISGEIDLSLPNPNFEEINKKLEEALRLSNQYGLMPSVGHCYLVLASLYQKMGNSENRKTALKSAQSIYEKYGMPYWIELTKSSGA